jgi:hypothetical protein
VVSNLANAAVALDYERSLRLDGRRHEEKAPIGGLDNVEIRPVIRLFPHCPGSRQIATKGRNRIEGGKLFLPSNQARIIECLDFYCTFPVDVAISMGAHSAAFDDA